jgi:hypothetical protein
LSQCSLCDRDIGEAATCPDCGGPPAGDGSAADGDEPSQGRAATNHARAGQERVDPALVDCRLEGADPGRGRAVGWLVTQGLLPLHAELPIRSVGFSWE